MMTVAMSRSSREEAIDTPGTVSRQAARNVLAFAARDLPAEAGERALMAIVDTLGVAIAGSGHEACGMLAETVLTEGSAGPATILGTGRRASVLDAALVNGTAAHMLDFDDSNSDLFGHLSAAILPSLLALAERERASGARLLHSFLSGYEAGCRFGNAVSRRQYTHGWHPTASIGIFAAVAANAVLLGLDEDEVAMAIGIAAHCASGIKSNFGSMTKPLGVGHASRDALLAVLLAQRGFTAGERALEHHHGYFAVYNDGDADAAALTEPWGPEPKILDRSKGVKQKRYPCCFAIAPCLDAILALREAHALAPEEIVSIEVAVHPIRFPHINVPRPATPLAAKFSVSYCAARAIVAGRIAIGDFEDGPAFVESATRALMEKVTLVKYAHEHLSGAEATIVTRDGRTLRHQVESAQGATYANPLTPAMVQDKFADCVTRRLGAGAVAPLWERLLALPDCPDVAQLTALMAERPQDGAGQGAAAHG